MRMRLAVLMTVGCSPNMEDEAFEEDSVLSEAESSILTGDAKLWRQTGDLARCGAWTRNENFSTGRYNVHRYAIDLSEDGPTIVRLTRSRGAWQPAIVAGIRDGTLVYGGERSSSASGVTATLLTSGRLEAYAEVQLETEGPTSIDLYVTGFGPIDAGYQRMLPRDARYLISARHDCALDSTWRTVADGLTQGGGQIPRQGLANRTLERALGVRVEPYGAVVAFDGLELVQGRVSHFGGPNDTGVSSTETGAISGERLRDLNDPLSPSDAILNARPEDYYYVAMRFDYTNVGRSFWSSARLLVVNPRTHAAIVVRPVDWGPNTRTGRIIDLSPQSMIDLDIDTDDLVSVSFAVSGSRLGPTF